MHAEKEKERNRGKNKEKHHRVIRYSVLSSRCRRRGLRNKFRARKKKRNKKRKKRKKKKERRDWMKRVTRFGGGRLKRSNRETRVGIVGNLGIHVRPIWHRNDAPGVENRRGRRREPNFESTFQPLSRTPRPRITPSHCATRIALFPCY